MDYLIGIDMGTTNTKAICFDAEGRAVASQSAPTRTLDTDEGIRYRAADLWPNVARLLTALTAKLSETEGADAPKRIGGISVSGMGEAGIPLDAKGAPLCDVIPWFDSCTRAISASWEYTLGFETLERITELKPQHIFTANKLLYLKQKYPEILRHMVRWHCVPDYISFCLTGCSAMDYSLATRTMMMDQQKKCWSWEILMKMSLSSDVLPRLVPSGAKIGTVTEKAASETGLLQGTPVFAGGHDHICGAFAIGASTESVAMDSCGTSEEILLGTSRYDTVKKCGSLGFNVGAHAAADRYYIAGGMPASGLSIDWYRTRFHSGSYQGSVTGANGVLFYPYLRGSSSPARNPEIPAVFRNLCDTTTAEDCMQAVYEGLAYEARMILEQIKTEQALRKIIAIGGGARNHYWMQIKANVYNLPIELPSVSESTALGAAILAGIGCGMYEDAPDAHQHTYRVSETILPDAESSELYKVLYQLYQTNLPMEPRKE